jgi:hypothetical protein
VSCRISATGELNKLESSVAGPPTARNFRPDSSPVLDLRFSRRCVFRRKSDIQDRSVRQAMKHLTACSCWFFP